MDGEEGNVWQTEGWQAVNKEGEVAQMRGTRKGRSATRRPAAIEAGLEDEVDTRKPGPLDVSMKRECS